MAISLQKLNQAEALILSKYPKMSASQKEAITNILNQKRAELLQQGGVSPADVPASPIGQQILEQQVTKGTYKPPVNEAEQKKIDAKNNALNIISQAEDLYFGGKGTSGDLSQGRLSGLLSGGAAALGFNQPLKTYKDLIQTVRPTFARAAGDSGNFSKTEQESAIKLFPKETATPEEAQAAFNNMRKKFGLPQKDFSQVAGPPIGEGLVGLFQQKNLQAQTPQGQTMNAVTSGIPGLNIYNPLPGGEGFNPTAVNAGADVLGGMIIPSILGKIKQGAVPLLASKASAGKAIEQTATNLAGKTISGDTIVAEIKKIADAATSTEKAQIMSMYEKAKELYAGKQIAVDIANKTLNMANDAFNAAGGIGNTAKAAVEAATARGIRTQLPQDLAAARNAYRIASQRDSLIRKLLFPAAVGAGAGVGISALLNKLGIGYQGQ